MRQVNVLKNSMPLSQGPEIIDFLPQKTLWNTGDVGKFLSNWSVLAQIYVSADLGQNYPIWPETYRRRLCANPL